jgi:protein-arginine kinase activator protein McsA
MTKKGKKENKKPKPKMCSRCRKNEATSIDYRKTKSGKQRKYNVCAKCFSKPILPPKQEESIDRKESV